MSNKLRDHSERSSIANNRTPAIGQGPAGQPTVPGWLAGPSCHRLGPERGSGLPETTVPRQNRKAPRDPKLLLPNGSPRRRLRHRRRARQATWSLHPNSPSAPIRPRRREAERSGFRLRVPAGCVPKSSPIPPGSPACRDSADGRKTPAVDRRLRLSCRWQAAAARPQPHPPGCYSCEAAKSRAAQSLARCRPQRGSNDTLCRIATAC